ncbi:MAG: LCP family protein [Candidatus Faecousia sp.]|nr:LCP family protein [Candidatus Faecousia sp.]
MAYQGRYNNGDGAKSRGGVWKIILIVVLCVVLLLGLLVGAAYFYLDSKLNKVRQATFEEKDVSGQDLSALIGNLDESNPTISISESTAPTEEVTEAPTEPDYGETGKIVNILLIGQDSREGGEESKLADGIMLLTLNKETRTLTTTSFLRDSYVKLADYRGHTCGWNRINTSYALGYSWYGTAGAMEMLNLTLENNYGVKVDANIELQMYSLSDLVDAMGGVEIELVGEEYTKMLEWQEQFNTQYEALGISWYRHVDIHEGMNNLNGDMALAYARERHVNDADSDMKRTARQRKIMAAMLDKLVSMSPQQLNELIDKALWWITTDLSKDEIKTYIKELTPYLFDLKLVSNQCPAEGTYWGEMVELPDGLSGVLKIDFEANKRILQAVMNGEEVEGTTIE